MDSPFESAERAAVDLRRLGADGARLAIVLGSGLTDAVSALDVEQDAPFSAVHGIPDASVDGHAGRILVGDLRGVRTVVFSGRIHAYEGHDLATVVHPVRTLARLGVETLLLTCSAGGIRDDLVPGAVVLVRDHLDFSGQDPLRGPHDPRLGPRFPGLEDAYDPDLRERLARAAEAEGVPVADGVYARMPGPRYETPAEIRALRAMGADLVGMSVVPEVVAARQAGVRTAALAVVTNRAAGLGDGAPIHDEVTRTAAAAAAKVGSILSRFVEVGWGA